MVRGGESPFETTSVVLLKEQVAALKEIQAARRLKHPGATLSHVIRDVIEQGLAATQHGSNKPFGYSAESRPDEAEVA